MKDYLVRAITRDGTVRGLACVATGLVDDACKRHGAYPTAAAALGRALIGGLLMGALLKTGQRVAMKFAGTGPLKKILVEADSDGTVRGYVAEPAVHLPSKAGKLDVGGAMGKAGFLTVVKDLGLKEPYTGRVALYTGEIAEDLAYYLTESEQVPSAVGLGVFVEPEGNVSAAGGFLIQAMPIQSEDSADRLADRIQALPPITTMLREGKNPEDILEMIFKDVPFDILEKCEVVFRCSCSRQRIEKALIALGLAEIQDMIQQQGEVDVACEYCRNSYHFTRQDLEKIAGEIS